MYRYPQFCAVARAAELIGERWTILVLRELFFGQQRFGDLRRRLSDVSPSVLSDRLGSLESAGIIRKTELPPPAASTVYELTELGRAFGPVLAELGRWGLRFLLPPRGGEQLDADRLPVVLSMFARSGPTEDVCCDLRVLPDTNVGRRPDLDTAPDVTITVTGGTAGTRISTTAGETEPPSPADVTITGTAVEIITLLAGLALPEESAASGRVRIEGDAARIASIPPLFDVAREEPSADAGPQGPAATQGE